MAASAHPPIVVPCNYDAMFKVDVMRYAPMREKQGSRSDLCVEVMTLSLQLDTLLKQQHLTQSSCRMDHGPAGRSFTDRANVVHSRLSQALAKSHITPEEYLREAGLDQLFPRVLSYLEHQGHQTLPCLSFRKTDMDSYLYQMASLHHILALARQIQKYILEQTEPKYLAHQLAVLYQSINSLPTGFALEPLRENIEANFKAVKAVLGDGEGVGEEVKAWVIELCDSVAQVVTLLPSDMTQEMAPLVTAIGRA